MKIKGVYLYRASIYLCVVLLSFIITLLFLNPYNAEAAEVGELTEGYGQGHIRMLERRLDDGVGFRVYYDPRENAGPDSRQLDYAESVMEYASEAYQDIVYTQGFNSPGFTFANPDKSYCYDTDKTIDIYIGYPGDDAAGTAAVAAEDFQDAPCFDIVEKGEGAYEAMILLPADYRSYLLKDGQPAVSDGKVSERLRGTLYHEILHIITYSYNRNIPAWYESRPGVSTPQGGDWYVEGLARYFETLAGSYDKFASKGYEKRSGNKTVISQDGANYLMGHPGRGLSQARYDYSLFWAYLHKKYGIAKIEEFSRKLRFIGNEPMNERLPGIIEATFGERLQDIIQGFGIAIYFKYFNPDITTRLDELKVMSLTDFRGDKAQDMGSLSSNFITVNLDEADMPDVITLKKLQDAGELRMNLFVRMSDGKVLQLKRISIGDSDLLCQLCLGDLKNSGVKELILILTNATPDCRIGYKILQ